MLILTIRTDKPESEIGLFDGEQKLAYETWQAHRQLAETIHQKIQNLLNSNKKEWQDIKGLVCYEGPGSFTGLRIGLTVGNALANSLKIPIVSSNGEDWIKKGLQAVVNGEDEKLALPDYGGSVFITKQKK